MKTHNRTLFVPLLLMLLLVLMMLTTTGSMAAQHKVDLGTAESYAVLAGSTITNTGPTTIIGDIGLHPGTAITGYDEITHTGELNQTNAAAEQAKIDMVTAYNDAAGRTPSDSVNYAELAGLNLTPGVYNATSSMALNGTLILDAEGDPNAAFIFQAGTTLITGDNSVISLINGATFCQVFWQVGSSATLGIDSYFAGHILADQSITANTRAEVKGQLLAREGAVTLDTNTIINDVCISSGSLAVTKVVAGETGEMTLPDFVITVTGPDGFSETETIESGETYTWTNLVPGTYTVTEDKTGLSDEWTVTGEGDVEVVADETAVTTITNTNLEEEVRELPRTGRNELLLVISVISIALAGGFFHKGCRREKEN